MPFNDPACFRFDRIPVRPIYWLWRPYLACGNPALLDGGPGAGKSLLTADLAARLTCGGRCPTAPGAQEGERPACSRRGGWTAGALAVVRSGLAARRRSASMRVRPTDPTGTVAALRPWPAANPKPLHRPSLRKPQHVAALAQAGVCPKRWPVEERKKGREVDRPKGNAAQNSDCSDSAPRL